MTIKLLTENPDLDNYPHGEGFNFIDPIERPEKMVLTFQGVPHKKSVDYRGQRQMRAFFEQTNSPKLFWLGLTEPLVRVFESLKISIGDTVEVRPRYGVKGPWPYVQGLYMIKDGGQAYVSLITR
jgi:hypothetical protein